MKIKDKESNTYRIFWGDTHHNSYTTPQQDPSIVEILSFARTHFDFYSGAYYTPTAECICLKRDRSNVSLPQIGGHVLELPSLPPDTWRGIRFERIKDSNTISREWDEFQKATAAHNSPGQFVTFPGYEWQGNGTWGDHNVIYKHEGLPVYSVMTLPELYNRLRGHDALVTPHHIGGWPGQ